MAKKKLKPPSAQPPARAVPGPAAGHSPDAGKQQAPGLLTAVLPFLERRSLAVAAGLIAIATLRIVSTYPETGPTWDEPGHMACGLQYLAQHVYRYEAQHPPLARVMSALGPYLGGARPLGVKNQDLEGVAVMYHAGHPERVLTLMRLGILPFFVMAGFVVYFWSRRLFGNAVAAAATGLFTLLPSVLAHAGLATTDMPLAACLGAACFALQLWAAEPTWKHSLLLGFATAMAVVSKFTALGFFPAAAVLALIAYLVAERPGLNRLAAAAKQRALPFGLAVITGALCIWTVYSFSFGKVPGWNISLPAPELFDGVKFALYHNDKGHAAYLLGEIRNTGWWYFFPVVLSVKTPLAFLVLLGFGTWICCRGGLGLGGGPGRGADRLARESGADGSARETPRKPRARLAYWLPLAFSLGILAPSMTSKVNIGVRHILPVYIGFSMIAAVALVQLLRQARTQKWAGMVAVIVVIWLAGSGAAHHPEYLAYFNELAGSHPERILVDSDLDWGQDTIRLARRLRELGANQVTFNTLNLTPDRLAVWPGFPPTKSIDPLRPSEGWTAVSPTLWQIHQFGLEHRYPDLNPWFAYLKPVERVGSLFLYYVPPGSLGQIPGPTGQMR